MHTPATTTRDPKPGGRSPSDSERRTARPAGRPAALALALLGAAACAAPGDTPRAAAVELLPGLEVVRSFDASMPPGNLAIGPDGRTFMSVHAFYGEPEAHVVELLEDGGTRPYPSAAWARPASARSSAGMKGGAGMTRGRGMNGVLGVRVDERGVLWMLDGQSAARPGRLIGWDTQSEALFAEVVLTPPATTPDSFLNDLAVDRTTDTVYVADSAGAVIVVDLASGAARRVLEGHRSTVPEDVDLVVAGRTLELGGAPARVGINPITLDAAGQRLYFGPMSGTSLYRVDTADLRDASLTEAELGSRVARYGDKPLSDGSTVDGAGNVYITAVGDFAIGVTEPSGAYRTLYQGPGLAWPDGFSVGADGWIYVTVNALHESPALGGGPDTDGAAFRILRFQPLAEAFPGR